MADPADLNPSTRPSGPEHRRLSNVPKGLILGIGIITGAALSYTFYEKMLPQQPVQQASQPGQQTHSAKDTAKNMTQEFENRTVMPPKDTPPPPPANPQRDSKPPEKPKPSPELQQLQAQYLRNLDQALHSKTTVRFEGMPAPAASPDPASAYGQRVTQVSAGLSSGERTVDRNNIGQFDRNNRWALNSKLEAPDTPFLILAGAVIPAIMNSGINSDLPGQVIAHVSQNVYDSATGAHLLIPQGTRLVGTYSSNVAYGQSRILMAWQRLEFPDGHVMDIGAMPGADQAGYSGFSDQTNNHYLRIFGSAILLSGVVAAVDLSQDSGSSSSSDKQRAGDALSEALGQSLGQVMTQMLQKNMAIAPTLEIRPGYRFNIMVTRDMRFPGVHLSSAD